jgi:SAM-dependent methyltransferase
VLRHRRAHAATITGVGWTPVGIDISRGQLRHARARLPVAAGDVARLPVRSASVPAVVCVLAHTDVPYYAATMREVARVLTPGGRFAHAGVHSCFLGGHADRRDDERIVINTRYDRRTRTFDSWTPHGVRIRVGGWQVTMADLANAVVGAGLPIERMAEDGPRGISDILGLSAVKP